MYRIRIKGTVSGTPLRQLGDLSAEEHMLALRLQGLADPYVPASSGAMAAGATVRDNVLIYPDRQAFPLYDGIRGGKRIHFGKDVHPGAQAFWVWAAKKDNMQQLREYAAELLRKKTGAKK